MGTGVATKGAGCAVISSLPQSAPVWITVGSGVEVCIKSTGSSSGPNACNQDGDMLLTPANGAYPYPGAAAIQSISVLDSVNFLKQFNACPHCNLEGAELSGLDFPDHTDLSNANLSGAVLYNTQMTQANFENAQFNSFNGQPAEIAMSSMQRSYFGGAVFNGTDFYQTDFTGGGFTCPQFINTVLTGVNFTNSNWQGGCTSPQLSQVTMNLDSVSINQWPNLYINQSSIMSNLNNYQNTANQNLGGLRLVDSAFLGLPPSFKKTSFVGATLDRSTFFLSDLSSANLSSTGTTQTSMVGTDFSNTNMQNANFNGSTVPAVFDNAYLVDANFSGTTLSSGMNNAAFNSTALMGANFQNATGVNSNQTGVDFSGSYLWASTQNVNFDGVSLPHANFTGALLANVTFDGSSNLAGADFQSAQCISCIFSDNAKLDGSNFSSAYIYGTAFGGATMSGANFTNAACCSAGTWVFAAASEAAAPNTAYQNNDPTLSHDEFDGVAACPNGQPGQNGQGCQGGTSPLVAPPADPACTSAGGLACPSYINSIGGNGTQGYDPGGAGGKALDAEFNNPSRILLEAGQQQVLVSDTDNHMVRAISGLSAPEPSIANFAGTGTAGDSGDGGLATNAELNSPQGLSQYPAAGPGNLGGSIAVADSGSNNVRLINASAGNISLYAGSGTACAEPVGSCGDGQLAVDAQLSAPQGIWFDSVGDLYIADTGNHKIRRVDATSGTISTIAGTGTVGTKSTAAKQLKAGGSCTNGSVATAFAMQSPTDITGDTLGNLYIVDQGAQSVYKISPAGCLTTFADSAKGLNDPVSITTDHQGHIYVANTGDNTIVSFSAWGIAQPAVGNGTAGYAGDGQLAINAELNQPQGVVSSPDGALYIVDTTNQRIRAATQQ